MKVMVATDGSDAALDAAKRALEMLRPGARIELAMVIPARLDPWEDAGGFEGPVITEKEAGETYAEQVAEGNEALAQTAAALEHTATALGEEVDVVLIPTDASPAEGLVQMATEHQVDLLVIGSREHGFFSRLFGGSVTEHLVRNAPCPVLVVPHDAST